MLNLSRRSFLARSSLASAAFVTAVSSLPQSRAESVQGWIRSGPVYQFSRVVPDGRNFTFQVFDAINPGKGVNGVVLSLIKNGGPPFRVAVREMNLPEFAIGAGRVVNRSLVGDLIGGIEGLIKRVRDIWDKIQPVVETVINDAKAAYQAIEKLITDIIQGVGQLGVSFFENAINQAGNTATGKAAVRYAATIAANANEPDLAIRVFRALSAATEHDRAIAYALALAIVNYPH